MQQSTGQAAPVPPPAPAKNPAAVALGRLGGLKGGKARAESLSAKRRKQIARAANLSAKKRTEIARKAANSRWKAKTG